MQGDAWEPVEVALGEDLERYDVDILQGTLPLRRLAATEPSVLYPSSQELADFGAPQDALSVRIAQVSALVGRGAERAVTVAVT